MLEGAAPPPTRHTWQDRSIRSLSVRLLDPHSLEPLGACTAPSMPSMRASEAIAADVNGLEVCHLHDATASEAGDTLRADGFHGHHVGGNEGRLSGPAAAL